MAFTIGSQGRVIKGGHQRVLHRLLAQSLSQEQADGGTVLAFYSGSSQVIRRIPDQDEGSHDLADQVMRESMVSMASSPRPAPNMVEMEKLSAQLRGTITQEAEKAVSAQANQEQHAAWELLTKPRLI